MRGAPRRRGAAVSSSSLVAGRAGLEQRSTCSRVQRPGLALTGYTDYIRYGRVQIMGGSEIGYLRKLDARARRRPSCESCAAAGSPASS